MPGTVIGDLDELLLNSYETKNYLGDMMKSLSNLNEGMAQLNQPEPIIPPTPTLKAIKEEFTFAKLGLKQDVTDMGISSFGLQVTATGPVTGWDVRLKGSLDGTFFTQIMQHTQANLTGTVLWTGATKYPCLYFRLECISITLGGGTKITVVGLGIK